ncbi:unnamed protein product, partial [Effrenium voratum]
ALRGLIAATWPGDDREASEPDFWKSKEGKAAAGVKPPSPALQRMAGHFRTLGLSAAASNEDLKRAYRKLVLQHHPDKNQGASQEAAAEKFREVSEAYEALAEFMRSGVSCKP